MLASAQRRGRGKILSLATTLDGNLGQCDVCVNTAGWSTRVRKGFRDLIAAQGGGIAAGILDDSGGNEGLVAHDVADSIGDLSAGDIGGGVDDADGLDVGDAAGLGVGDGLGIGGAGVGKISNGGSALSIASPLLLPLAATTTGLLLGSVLLPQGPPPAPSSSGRCGGDSLPRLGATSSLPAATLTLEELLAELFHEATVTSGGGTAAVASGEGGTPGGGEARWRNPGGLWRDLARHFRNT